MCLKKSAKCWLFCLSLNVFTIFPASLIEALPLMHVPRQWQSALHRLPAIVGSSTLNSSTIQYSRKQTSWSFMMALYTISKFSTTWKIHNFQIFNNLKNTQFPNFQQPEKIHTFQILNNLKKYTISKFSTTWKIHNFQIFNNLKKYMISKFPKTWKMHIFQIFNNPKKYMISKF